MPYVKVKVPVRANSDGSTFPGFGSAGIYWPTGDTTRDVTEEQLTQLLADSAANAPFIVMVLPDAPVAPPVSVSDVHEAPKPSESKYQKPSR